MPIEWDDNLRTGIKIIDDQHRELLVMLNRLSRFRCGKESFFEALEELYEFVDIHFKTEESYMVKLNYPEYVEHKATHDELIEKLNVIQEKIDNSQNVCDIGDEIFHVVEDWILAHYTNEDIKLAGYIKKNT